MKIMRAFRRNEHGQAMVEYAFILGFVSIVGALALLPVGQAVIAFFASVVIP
jgi:Flp pilus assembly pilin Flp